MHACINCADAHACNAFFKLWRCDRLFVGSMPSLTSTHTFRLSPRAKKTLYLHNNNNNTRTHCRCNQYIKHARTTHEHILNLRCRSSRQAIPLTCRVDEHQRGTLFFVWWRRVSRHIFLLSFYLNKNFPVPPGCKREGM